jgi:hypothetical protein
MIPFILSSSSNVVSSDARGGRFGSPRHPQHSEASAVPCISYLILLISAPLWRCSNGESSADFGTIPAGGILSKPSQ